jgi:hypothetical protein
VVIVLVVHIKSVLRKRVVGITAVGGQIAKVQGHQEPILFALVNVYSIKNVRRDYWKMILE